MKRIVCAVCLLALLGALCFALADERRERGEPACVFPSVKSSWTWERSDGGWRLYDRDQSSVPLLGKCFPSLFPRVVINHTWTDEEMGYDGKSIDAPVILPENCGDAKKSAVFVRYGTPEDGKWGMADKTGKFLREPEFDAIEGFTKANDSLAYGTLQLFFGKLGTGWRAYRADGSQYCDVTWTDDEFKSSECPGWPIEVAAAGYKRFGVVRKIVGGEAKYGCFSGNEFIAPVEYDGIVPLKDSFFGRIGECWQLYDLKNHLLTGLVWPDGELRDPENGSLPFDSFNAGGYGAVRVSSGGLNRYGVIKEDGALVIPCVYDQVIVVRDAQLRNWFFGRRGGLWRMYGMDGSPMMQKSWTQEELPGPYRTAEEIFSGFFDDTDEWLDGKTDGGAVGFLNAGSAEKPCWGIIDLRGNWLVEPGFEKCEYRGDSVYFGKNEGKWMLYKIGRGEPLLKHQWDDSDFYGGECDDEPPLEYFDESGMSVIRFGSGESER
ncbi:MAG: WG repeat-containing protein [Clostridia bacterium]|nr:WG repeat-containing protein [Clostridia bacterium]